MERLLPLVMQPFDKTISHVGPLNTQEFDLLFKEIGVHLFSCHFEYLLVAGLDGSQILVGNTISEFFEDQTSCYMGVSCDIASSSEVILAVGSLDVGEFVGASNDKASYKYQDRRLEHNNRGKRNQLKKSQHANNPDQPNEPIMHDLSIIAD
jgi:hypothetical protein